MDSGGSLGRAHCFLDEGNFAFRCLDFCKPELIFRTFVTSQDACAAAKGSASFELAQRASCTYAIHAFLKRALPRSLGIKKYSRPHHKLPQAIEIAHSVMHLAERNVNEFCPGRSIKKTKTTTSKHGFQDYLDKGWNDWASSYSVFLANRKGGNADGEREDDDLEGGAESDDNVETRARDGAFADRALYGLVEEDE